MLRMLSGGPPCARRVAPRERRWTPTAITDRAGGEGCSARAEMDPYPTSPSQTAPRLLRASGDGPQVANSVDVWSTVAPRERRWTQGPPMNVTSSVGCSARAEMDPRSSTCARASLWLLRASGDGPIELVTGKGAALVAPRERRWTLGAVVIDGAALGCSARAEMDPVRRSRIAPRLLRARSLGAPRERSRRSTKCPCSCLSIGCALATSACVVTGFLVAQRSAQPPAEGRLPNSRPSVADPNSHRAVGADPVTTQTSSQGPETPKPASSKGWPASPSACRTT